MRLLCATVLAFSAGLFTAVADDKKDPPKDTPSPAEQADRLKKIEKNFTEEEAALFKRFRAAKDQAEANGIRTEAKELAVLTTGKVLAVAEIDPKGDTAFNAIHFAITKLLKFGVSGPDVDKLIGIATEHHLSNSRIKDLLGVAGKAGPAGEKLLTAAIDKATDKGVKGTALYHLGMLRADQADNAEDEKATTAAIEKVLDLLERAGKEAPQTPFGSETLGKAAANAAKAIRGRTVGFPINDLEGTDLAGKTTKLSDYKGKVVLLDIWATWCPPCRAMIPHEREMVKKLDGKPFVLISASADAEKDTLTKFLEKEPMPWTHWWVGSDHTLTEALRIQAFPSLYLIDAKGVIRKKWIGSPGNDVLDKAVEELVKEASSKG